MQRTFDIREYFDFKGKCNGWVHFPCPSCQTEHNPNRPALSIDASSGAYKCHKGCDKHDIRNALGAPITTQISNSQVRPPRLRPNAPVSSQKKQAIANSNNNVIATEAEIEADHQRLINARVPVIDWLLNRGFTIEAIKYYKLGLVERKRGPQVKRYWGVSIPLPTTGGYYRKVRLAPTLKGAARPNFLHDWDLTGIPSKQVYFAYKPEAAMETYLCEGEWDAMLLGWRMREENQAIAVATFVGGCSSVPDEEELAKLPGQVTIFYDRNDPINPKTGLAPGDEGAKKVARALKNRSRIAQVPMPEGCIQPGWDVNDALKKGYTVADFIAAAKVGRSIGLEHNSLARIMKTPGQLRASTPDYMEWLVPELLTPNELFILGTSPRGGKSLLAMSLAHAVATGGNFLGRPALQGSVIYAHVEDNDFKMKLRMEAQGWTDDLPIYLIPKFTLSQTTELRELCEEVQPRLIILDTFRSIRDDGGKEADAEIVRVLRPLNQMANDLHCAVLLVHHSRKINDQNLDAIDIFDLLSGSGGIRSTCRGAWFLAPSQNSHRLVVETGFSEKMDVRVRLDPDTLKWRMLGEWKPPINTTYRERILLHLVTVGETTVPDCATACDVPVASTGNILSKLVAEGVIHKRGGRGKSLAIYFADAELPELFHKMKQNETEMKHSNLDVESNSTSLHSNQENFYQQNSGNETPENDLDDLKMKQDTVTRYNVQQEKVLENNFDFTLLHQVKQDRQHETPNQDTKPTTSQNTQSVTPVTPDQLPLAQYMKCKLIQESLYIPEGITDVVILNLDGDTCWVTFQGCRQSDGVPVRRHQLRPA